VSSQVEYLRKKKLSLKKVYRIYNPVWFGSVVWPINRNQFWVFLHLLCFI